MSRRHVAVAVSLPKLELDRPFTYRLPDGVDAPTGTYVSVPFHGRTVKGWVLGETDDVPARVLPIRRVLSSTPVFGERDLALYRWVAERYLAPLATVIDRAHPPRVAGEEMRASPAAPPLPPLRVPGVLAGYAQGRRLLDAARRGGGAFLVRPLPEEEIAACLEAVAACLDGGRDAVVVIPEAEPLPATALAVLEAVGSAGLAFVGGEARERYRSWLDLRAGAYRVVVGTRPAVFAPVPRIGLVWVHREAHPGHREERSPYHHVREVALARARLEGAACVLSALSPSAEGAALADDGELTLVRASRERERQCAPLVETVRPAEEDRSPRLSDALRRTRGAFLLVSRRGYGLARVCRDCGELVRCTRCAGAVRVAGGRALCVVCAAEARCASCGGVRFGIDRGGTERIEQWARRATDLAVVRVDERDQAGPPAPDVITVGTAAAVKDFGPVRLGLVAVLDPDRARRRAGVAAAERAVATWMEAAAWAGPRTAGGRVIVHTNEPGDAAIQALVRWDPWHFHRAERRRREEAGFPPRHPVFRVTGTSRLAAEMEATTPTTLLVTAVGEQAVCLVALRPDALPAFRERVLDLVGAGIVTRVEADPQL